MAKIADLGMARIMPRMRGAATMTKAPGASIYMPPEALEDKSRYDTSIDIFSMGVVTLFTLSQMFPDPLSAAFMDDSGRMVGRTELERRAKYMQEVLRQFSQEHPFVYLIQQCLKNRITERPSIQRVQHWLEEGRASVKDREFDVDILSLTQLLASRDQSIQTQREEICTLTQQNGVKEEENGALKEEIEVLKAQMASLREMVRTLQDGNIPTFPTLASPTAPPTFAVSCFAHLLCAKIFVCWQVGASCILLSLMLHLLVKCISSSLLQQQLKLSNMAL